MAGKDDDDLVGHRFACDFEVLYITHPEELAMLRMRGQYFELSVDELRTIIDRGLVIEVPRDRSGRVS